MKDNTMAVTLVSGLCFISPNILDEAEAYCYDEHESGRFSNSEYFIIMRRLRMLRKEHESK